MDYQAMAGRLLVSYYAVTSQPPLKRMDGMKKGEGFVLAYVNHKQLAQPSELAAAVGTSTAHMTKILNSMEQKQWIRRTLDTRDRRRILVSLTQEGQAQAQENEAHARGCMSRMLEELGPEDAAALLRIMERLRAIHENRGAECHSGERTQTLC